MSISETIALQSADAHIKEQSKISKTVQSNFTPPIQEVYYNPALDKIEFSSDFHKVTEIIPNYEAIYEGCTEDIQKAFGLDLPGSPYEISELSDTMKSSIKDKLIRTLNTTDKWYDCKIQNADEVKSLASEMKELLEAITYSKCFYLKDKAGVERGVIPPRSLKVQFGLVPVPWKFVFIDFKAQRFTDIAHILDKLLDYDSYKNLGSSGRLDKTTGRRVDINDGRHSAILLALTGNEYCLISGLISDKRSMNMIIFMIKNSLAKPVELYDELHTIKGKAETEKDEGGLQGIDTRLYTMSSGSGIRVSDRQVHEMFQTLDKFGIRLVPAEYGKKNRKLVKVGDWYRVDMLINFFQNPNYTNWSATQEILDDSYIFDALYIIKEVLIRQGGYAPHELIWAILELFHVIRRDTGMPDRKRTNIRDCIITALNDWIPTKYKTSAPKLMLNRSYDFYDAWTNKAKGRIPTNHPIWGVANNGNSNVHHFLTTGLYSIVQECKLLSKTQKALFVAPTVKWTVVENNGSEKKYDTVLFDDRNLPFSFDESFKNNVKTKTQKMNVVVVGDDEDESDDE